MIAGLFDLPNVLDWLQSQVQGIFDLLLYAASAYLKWGRGLTFGILDWIAHHTDTKFGAALTALHESISTGALHHAVRVSTFLADLWSDVDLLLVCVTWLFTIWSMALVLHLFLMAKGHIWSSSN